YGYKEFVIALGYKGEVIKEYFLDYHHHRAQNLKVELKTGNITASYGDSEDWIVHLLDTGSDTQTGGRLKRAANFIGREPFMFTYGDGVSNVNIDKLLAYHRASGKLATLTAVRPPARFGQMVFDGDNVTHFEEKPQIGEGWINGGYFVLQPEAIDYIPNDLTAWEREPLEKIASNGQLTAYRHENFWQCMDTLRDVQLLEKLWQEGAAPWKLWD
ncbi:MAG: sugar phosphate nucleotidyltransferase, partial [Chloroflexota bacterium]